MCIIPSTSFTEILRSSFDHTTNNDNNHRRRFCRRSHGEVLPPKLVMNCMLFLMRTGIVPMWEDAQNRNGGCFSYKVANKEVNSAWKQLSYVTVGETISTNLNVVPIVNGITISPKKNFCIIKIWMANCNFQNAGIIRELEGITAHGCLFKKHTPEY